MHHQYRYCRTLFCTFVRAGQEWCLQHINLLYIDQNIFFYHEVIELIFEKIVFRVQGASSKLWAFLLGTYWVSAVTYFVLVKQYKHMIHLRGKEQAHEKARPQQYVCLVRDIPAPPKHMSRAEQVDAFFRKLHPDTYESCTIVTNLSKVCGCSYLLCISCSPTSTG